MKWVLAWKSYNNLLFRIFGPQLELLLTYRTIFVQEWSWQ
jgi:hypothetical protein